VAAHKFFVETDKVDEVSRLVENVQEQAWLLGTTLSMHVPYLRPAFRQAIANGRNVRILLIKPGGAAMEMAVLRAGPEGLGQREQEEQLSNNLAILRQLAHVGPHLEVRLIDYLAPYTLYAYDPRPRHRHDADAARVIPWQAPPSPHLPGGPLPR
jgi:hypothetical protein